MRSCQLISHHHPVFSVESTKQSESFVLFPGCFWIRNFLFSGVRNRLWWFLSASLNPSTTTLLQSSDYSVKVCINRPAIDHTRIPVIHHHGTAKSSGENDWFKRLSATLSHGPRPLPCIVGKQKIWYTIRCYRSAGQLKIVKIQTNNDSTATSERLAAFATPTVESDPDDGGTEPSRTSVFPCKSMVLLSSVGSVYFIFISL